MQSSVCNRAGTLFGCRKAQRQAAPPSGVPIASKSKQIGKQKEGGAKKSQNSSSLAIQKRRKGGARSSAKGKASAKSVPAAGAGTELAAEQDSVEDIKVQMARLMKQLQDLKSG